MINLYTADCVSAFQMILDPHPILNILGSCGFLSRLPWSCLRSVCRGEVCIEDIYDIIIPLDSLDHCLL